MKEMKDSGIEWIGEIPNLWVTKKIKNAVSMIGSGTTPPSEKHIYYENGNICWIQSGDIYGKNEITKSSVLINKTALNDISTLKIYKHDFIIMAMYGGSVGNISISKIDACVNQACCCIKPNNNNDTQFMYYWLSICKTDFLRASEGGTQPNISQNKIKNQYYIQPPLEEQQAISAYLDEKCDDIDSLVSDIQKQIEILEQYKRSVITEAVTKGLNKNVEMKDSGIEWIGEIPKHWNTHPIYCYFSERKNKNSLGLENNLLSLSYGKIVRKNNNSNDGLLPESFNTYNIIEKDDIIIRPTDLQNDKRSLRTAIAREHGIITSAYIAMKAIKTVNSEYFHYLLHTYDIMKVFYNMGNGVRQGLNFSEFSRIMVFEPTIEEQNEIVAFLQEKCTEIDKIISGKKQQIETIEKYKKSLIYECVTGKREI